VGNFIVVDVCLSQPNGFRRQYSVTMPWGLKRFHQLGQTHFVTFSCYRRLPLLATPSARKTFENALERVRWSLKLCVYGYVVMPEHVHLLVNEPDRGTLADAIKSLKQGVSRRLIGCQLHFWQKRYYDFNVRNYRQFAEKLRYIHNNPVKRGLCARPEDWLESSFLPWATGCEGRVEIECEWTARRRERAAGKLCPSVELPLFTSELPHSSQKRA
jgi:putative transposase